MLDLAPLFAAFPELETQRCRLRAVTPADVEDIFTIRSDPQVTRFLGHHPMSSLDEAAERVEMLRKSFPEQTGFPWAVVSRTEERLIGMCSLWRLVPQHHRAEIGYELGSAWWGRGIMTEVISAVLTHGFETMGLHSVEAQMDPGNLASRGLLEKLGFVQEGYFRENYWDPTQGRFTDTAVLSLLSSTWTARRR